MTFRNILKFYRVGSGMQLAVEMQPCQLASLLHDFPRGQCHLDQERLQFGIKLASTSLS